MDIWKLIEAVRLCGSTPKAYQCKQCAYWDAGDMRRCIPNMTGEAATALSALQAENEKLRAELKRVKVERDAYQAYFKDLSSKPDCNTCEKRNCEYRPKPGDTVRVNCPLYSGPERND